MQEVPKHLRQVQALGPTDFGVLRRNEARHVHTERRLQRRMAKQVGHHFLFVRILLDTELDAHVIGRNIFDIEQKWHLTRRHNISNPLDERCLIDIIRDARNRDGLLPA